MQILTTYYPFRNDDHHTVVIIKLSRFLSTILLTIQTKYFLTNTIIYCLNVPSSLFQQFGQWSDTRSWKTNKCTFHSHGSFYKQIRAFFVFLVLVFEAPLGLAFKGSPYFCLWSDVMEAAYFHQRQSHVYVDTGRDLFRVRHQGGNWPDICRI